MPDKTMNRQISLLEKMPADSGQTHLDHGAIRIQKLSYGVGNK